MTASLFPHPVLRTDTGIHHLYERQLAGFREGISFAPGTGDGITISVLDVPAEPVFKALFFRRGSALLHCSSLMNARRQFWR
ncbi:hypothetical protein EHW66_00530 [Erwinia psidii]|uniref:hypothetical protein n=1 Tax=Erwinia psidii TaxID=69224 RepID=UPI00226B6F9F|nr:hypothetical protein [Erwinia psidii]MCX8963549.1 hypothetical protein [Erwinia psidii]